MNLIDRVLNRSEFRDAPPVLIDVGSAGGVHSAWRRLAPYSVCLAFDPDARGASDDSMTSRGYRRMHLQVAAVVPACDDDAETEVCLTRSPHCSSLLEPERTALADWRFADLFTVEGHARVPCVTLARALEQHGLRRVDWFKSDSQGLDLSLFLSLPAKIRDRTLAVELEPGLIDAYCGEDKLPATLDAMDRREFWLAKMKLHGSQRIRAEHLTRLTSFERRALGRALPTSPGWAELTHLNTLRGREDFTVRDWLLAWVIATVHAQHGFALDLAHRARAQFDDSMLGELERASLRRLKRRALSQWPGLAARGVLRRAAALFW